MLKLPEYFLHFGMKRVHQPAEDDETPLRKRQALERTGTIELQAPESNSALQRRTSSVLGSLQPTVESCLSVDRKNNLERKISSILEPSTSIQTITVSSDPEVAKNEPNLFLPSEIWIEIFIHLSDPDRWRLAQTCARLFAIFENWVGFNSMMIYYTNNLGYFSFNNAIVEEPIVSSNFVFTDLYNNAYKLKKEGDIKLLTGKTSISGRALYKLLFRTYSIMVFPPGVILDQDNMIDDNAIAIVPLAPCSTNVFPAEFLPTTDKNIFTPLFGSQPLLSVLNNFAEERFLSASFVIHPDKSCEFLFRLDSAGVKHALESGKELSNIEKQSILMLVKQNALKAFRLMNWRKPKTFNMLPACQPQGFKDLKLHEYQLRALAWMKNIENTCHKKKYVFSTLTRVPAVNVYVNAKQKENLERRENSYSRKKEPYFPFYSDERNWDCTFNSESNNPAHQDSFTTRGGILADEMGLGKTISTIALILSNPRKKNSSGEWEKYSEVDTMFESGATLIVCPNQLVEQWKNEIENRTNLKVFPVQTITSLKSCSYETILDCDVVVAPHSLLTTNKQYLKRYSGKIPNARAKTGKNVTLHYIGWHRIIIDEAHEILSDVTKNGTYIGTGLSIWSKYSSNFRWYVTGTPLPRGRASFVGLANFLEIELESGNEFYEDWEENAPLELVVSDIVHKCLFWRNTKQEVESQVDIPPLTEVVELIQLSAVERSLYDAAGIIENANDQRQICSFPLRSKLFPAKSGLSSLKEAPQYLLNMWRELTISALERITTTKQTLKEAIITLEKAQEAWDEAKVNPPPKCTWGESAEGYRAYRDYKAKEKAVKDGKDNVRMLELSINRDEDNVVTWLSQTACFTRLFPSDDSAVCGICEKDIQNKAEIGCNHFFCSSCISKHIQKHNRCPTCSKPALLEDIKFVESIANDDNKSSLSNTEGNWEKTVIETYGSKMAAIASHLRNLISQSETVKVIVFSQYNETLAELSSILAGNETTANQMVECKGNIHIRKKQLEAFNSTDPDSPRMLFMSLANSPSGTHLAVATHIILVDPVVGCKEEAQATDAQAIARAHRLGQDKPVVAIRFIVEASIEQIDYEQSYGASATQ